MYQHASAQLAQLRRQQMIAEVTYYRQTRQRRTCTSSRPRRPLSALQSWLAKGHL